MKVNANQTEVENKSTESPSACCGTNNTTAKEKVDTCCDQPTDGSSCCDKSLPKKENAKKHSCC